MFVLEDGFREFCGFGMGEDVDYFGRNRSEEGRDDGEVYRVGWWEYCRFLEFFLYLRICGLGLYLV